MDTGSVTASFLPTHGCSASASTQHGSLKTLRRWRRALVPGTGAHPNGAVMSSAYAGDNRSACASACSTEATRSAVTDPRLATSSMKFLRLDR